jgi:hypothetical protein
MQKLDTNKVERAGFFTRTIVQSRIEPSELFFKFVVEVSKVDVGKSVLVASGAEHDGYSVYGRQRTRRA